MNLDFWQFSEGPIPRIVALIAERVVGTGDRLLVTDADDARRGAISAALWEAKPDAFLANGEAAAPHAARQPILLSAHCDPANGARVLVLADGKWRDGAAGFDRTILLFGEDGAPDARAVWRQFDGRADVERGYFAQESGKWVRKA
ncbi:DNA polymerase III subunit chi [Altererythrobacter aerius]|uniref:DNA polymerase III subunit chi n=1 Tax=Tsuneonella aeria TaxID=1837929 RepID=A0A6I4TCZ9_9SPHN|nr:DNA polymerase III subunit chi [Tsuneonella aeria]MXO74486.1 DNA polymerase III subunit chi [Tsuneonella aeria]